jgi:alpha-ketoglutarate-dependent taurine dioxygenase
MHAAGGKSTASERDGLSSVVVTDDEANALAKWVESTIRTTFDDESEFAGFLVTQLDFLPARLRAHVGAIRAADPPDAVVLRGLPVERFGVPPTPNTGSAFPSSETWSPDPATAIHGLFAAAIGEVIGYAGTQYGKLYTDLMPMAGDGDLVNSAFGFRHEFGFHTDVSFHQLPPTYFGLLCIRNHDHVKSRLAFMREVVLDREVDDLLRSVPMRAPQSFADRVGVSADDLPQLPLVFGSRENPQFRMISTDFIRSDFPTDESYEAAVTFKAALAATSVTVDLQAGDALWLDNLRVAHAREAFTPRFDGTDRWVKRAVLVPNLDILEPVVLPGADRRILDYEMLAKRFRDLPTSWESGPPAAAASSGGVG